MYNEITSNNHKNQKRRISETIKKIRTKNQNKRKIKSVYKYKMVIFCPE